MANEHSEIPLEQGRCELAQCDLTVILRSPNPLSNGRSLNFIKSHPPSWECLSAPELMHRNHELL